jgi:hypothetical protein
MPMRGAPGNPQFGAIFGGTPGYKYSEILKVEILTYIV